MVLDHGVYAVDDIVSEDLADMFGFIIPSFGVFVQQNLHSHSHVFNYIHSFCSSLLFILFFSRRKLNKDSKEKIPSSCAHEGLPSM